MSGGTEGEGAGGGEATAAGGTAVGAGGGGALAFFSGVLFSPPLAAAEAGVGTHRTGGTRGGGLGCPLVSTAFGGAGAGNSARGRGAGTSGSGRGEVPPSMNSSLRT